MEKAQFPDYFSQRAQLKKDYISWYTKKYGINKFEENDEGHIHELDAHHHDDDHHSHGNSDKHH
jgi:hypothetical protein